MISSVKLHGKTTPLSVAHLLKSGILSMIFENGSIRYLCLGETEIIRMIFFAVRDKDWLTVQPEIYGERIVKSRKGIRITFKSRYRYNDIDFEVRIRFSIRENCLIAKMTGIAHSSFLKNRIGFCILHPVEPLAGKDCMIFHHDGTSVQKTFPVSISPGQPFSDIQSMEWKFSNTGTARLKFEGDIFETEDQRNWSDASYKTYSTPLDLPFPVRIQQGTTMHQEIELAIEGQSGATATRNNITMFTISDDILDFFPDIGVGSSSRPQPVTGKEAEIVRNINFSHIRGELHLFDNQLAQKYAALAEEADKTGLPVELCLLFGPESQAEFRLFLGHYGSHPITLKRIAVLSKTMKTTPESLISDIVPALRKVFPGIPVAAGTNCNFAELNRYRPPTNRIDNIILAIHPQEHAADERSLVENTGAQEYVIRSTAEIFPGKLICVSPVTLQRRFNANIATYETEVDMPANMDPRQMSLFGAVWTVGSLKYLIEAGAGSITFFETLGERGLLMGDYGPRWPLLCMAKKGMIFPVFHIFRILLQNERTRLIHSSSNQPLLVNGFTIVSGDRGLVFLSNMTSRYQKILLKGLNRFRIMFTMHTGNFDQITREIKMPGETINNNFFTENPGSFRIRPYETMIIHFPGYDQ